MDTVTEAQPVEGMSTRSEKNRYETWTKCQEQDMDIVTAAKQVQ